MDTRHSTLDSQHSSLFGWTVDPPGDGRALFTLDASWTWQRHSYAELAALTRRMAAGLRIAGHGRNDVIALVAPPCAELVASLYGIMLAGATAAVLAPPRALQNPGSYAAHIAGVCAACQPRALLTTRDLAPALRDIVTTGPAIVPMGDVWASARETADAGSDELADLALLQFTAGSSGPPRGVRIPHAALDLNVRAIRNWLEWSSADASAFWIPQYHDMGLIGGLVAPLASQGDLWLMTPEQFVRRPIEYLRCFGAHGARLTATPAFGLEHILRRVRAEDLSGLDFSQVKGFIIGAELISPDTLDRFQDLLTPRGLRRGALLPAYGLAEATLAVSGLPLGESWIVRSAGPDAPAVVGCGAPLEHVGVEVVSGAAGPLTDGQLGEIVIRGPSVAAGYIGPLAAESLTTFEEGTLQSGDAGFRMDGQIFPVGRLGDSLRIRGQAVFAEVLEAELHKLGYARERNAVLLGVTGGKPRVVWLAERADGTLDDAASMLARLAEGAAVSVVCAPRGAIARTSSGKPRRRVLWHDFTNGRISGKVCLDFDPSS